MKFALTLSASVLLALSVPSYADLEYDLTVAADNYCSLKKPKDLASVNALLKKGANPHKAGSSEMTAVDVAAYRACPQLLELLLPNPKVKIDAIGSLDMSPFLFTLANYKDSADEKRMVDLYLKAGANVNQIDPNQIQTPLMLASGMHLTPPRPELIAKLLKAGADAKFKTPNGYTPLNAGIPDLQSLQLLLNAGADASAAAKIDGLTPLHSVCERGLESSDKPDPQAAARIKLLMDHGGNINALRLDTKESVLLQNIKHGNPDCVDALFKAGANPNLKNSDGKAVKDEIKAQGIYSPEVIKVVKRNLK
jgi:ankyrin repeat protein